jgi:signal transduction histidine kinase
VAACVVLLHLALLPALYFGLGYVIRKSHEELFIEHARTFARVVADEFELGVALEDRSRTVDLLDLAIIHGEARYAELIVNGNSIMSSLNSPNINAPRRSDLSFGADSDNLYFVVLPIVHAGRAAELRVGFDEQPTAGRIQLALRRMVMMLGLYFAAAMLIGVLLARRMSRPVHRLQLESRAIASGDYTQALRVATGIRELHELADDLENMRRELVGVNDRLQAKIKEKEISEARREELQKQLRHRQRLETVGTLAGGVAHEFNNVLVPIILFTGTAIQDLPPSSASRADLERVLAAAQRAKEIVRKVLTFSSELGDVKLELIDLKAVITDGLNLFAALAPSSIEIRREIEDDVPRVWGDAALGVHLVLNLCTNAYQAMQETNRVLTIGLRLVQQKPVEGESRNFVELWVADTGHGMDPSTVERIFEPFFTTRAVGDGTGLGLSVVHGIVDTFGGRIEVESESGRGSTFRLYFPTVRSEQSLQTARPAA